MLSYHEIIVSSTQYYSYFLFIYFYHDNATVHMPQILSSLEGAKFTSNICT